MYSNSVKEGTIPAARRE